MISPYLFSLDKKPPPPSRIGWWWTRARSVAGIDRKWRLHDLRHWSPTIAINGGHDVRTVASRLGHALAHPRRPGELSFAGIALVVLNQAVRSLLATWRALAALEAIRRAGMSPTEQERGWDLREHARRALGEVRATLLGYADVLVAVAGVPKVGGPRR